MNFAVTRISSGPKHHLFGFHDLPITNAKGDLVLALEVDDISHPPLPGETCLSGVIDLKQQFRAIHSTHTWNYPQGARQQWLGDTDLFTCNDRAPDGQLISILSDARAGKVIDQFPFPIHCLNAATRQAFYFNYDRVHSCGGYGYTPNQCQSVKSVVEDIPTDDGIFVGNLDTKETKLIASLSQIAACGEKKPVRTGYPHYVTHFMLNPSGTRLAFLHQYRVPDGGDIARILVCDLDGGNLRCLGKGFLSHYTWVDDETIFTWGEDQRALCAFREAAWLRIPGVLQSALLAKKILRLGRSMKPLIKQMLTDQKRSHTNQCPSGSSVVQKTQDKAFLLITDAPTPIIKKVALGILTEDGHPMANPRRPHLVVNDTYPHKDGNRTLMFYDVDKNERIDVGQFKMIPDRPDASTFDWQQTRRGLDARVSKVFDRDGYLFWRSGLHCDLHPRWSHDGKIAFFDSIHEGTRQIYAVEGPEL